MGSLDGVIEPIYFLITSIGFVILSFIQYKKTGKTVETIYLTILAVFFIVCFIILNFYWWKVLNLLNELKWVMYKAIIFGLLGIDEKLFFEQKLEKSLKSDL